MASNNEKFPVTNKQAARIVQGIHTEVLVSGFKDKIFVVVTQYGRIGSLINTTFDIPPNLARSPSTVPTTSKFLMNSAASELSDLYLLYAASVSRAIATSNPRESRPVVLGIALKDTGDNTKRKELHETIMEMIRDTIV